MTGQQEYRITGEQITKLLYFEEMFPSISNIIREILSCPVHEQQYPIPNDEQCRICEQAIRKDATGKVLEELHSALQCGGIYSLAWKLDELRSKGDQP